MIRIMGLRDRFVVFFCNVDICVCLLMFNVVYDVWVIVQTCFLSSNIESYR